MGGKWVKPFTPCILPVIVMREHEPLLNADLVIFDCDGVLVDSEPIINRAHAETLRQHGYAVTAEMLAERFTGVSDADMLGTIEREHGIPMPCDYEVRVKALIDSYCETSLVATPGTREALAALEVPVCVASSGCPAQTRNSLRVAGCWIGLIRTCSARLWSPMGSLLPICFSTRRAPWAWLRRVALSSRTAHLVSRRLSRRV